jgi:acetoacetate decarboxylase
MSTAAAGPQGNPGDIVNWPMLKISYRTDPEAIARLLPPGISPGRNPHVNITIYNFPVHDEPEYGLVVNVEADFAGIAGEYTLAIGINQEAPLFVCHEMWGQPKYPLDTTYFRLGNHVHAKCVHQGVTFIEFSGDVVDTLPNPADHETNEWWIKSLRSVDPTSTSFDFPPHVVRVYSKYGTAFLQELKGTLILRESKWDPIATLLPMREQLSARLWTPVFKDRRITLAGPLDPVGFVPFIDVISGTRWPGTSGGPKA